MSLAGWETSRRFESNGDVNGDVTSAATVQLLNPVDLALAARPGREIVSLNQHTAYTEPVRPHNARADKCWVWYDERDKPHYVAVLDYKKLGTIVEGEFGKAILPPGTDHRWQVHRMFERGRHTLFKDNSAILMKQATNYANQYSTRYVAFFGWNCLILLYLVDAEENNGGLGAM